MTALSACFPAGAKVLLTADDVDGVANGLLPHGANISGWKNQGAGVADFIVTDASNGLKRRRALMKKSDENTSVRFDGIYSLLTSLASKTSLAFLHNPAVFDLFIVLRKLETSINNTGTARAVFGCHSGQTGLLIQLADASLGKEGMVRVVLGSGGLLTTLLTSDEILAPVGTPYKLLVRGDGTNLSVSHDFVNFESAVIATPLGAPGDATNDYSVGGGIPTQGLPNCLGADVFALAAYTTNANAAALLTLRDNLEAALGDGV